MPPVIKQGVINFVQSTAHQDLDNKHLTCHLSAVKRERQNVNFREK